MNRLAHSVAIVCLQGAFQRGQVLFRFFRNKTEHLPAVIRIRQQTGIVEYERTARNSDRHGRDEGQQSLHGKWFVETAAETVLQIHSGITVTTSGHHGDRNSTGVGDIRTAQQLKKSETIGNRHLKICKNKVTFRAGKGSHSLSGTPASHTFNAVPPQHVTSDLQQDAVIVHY